MTWTKTEEKQFTDVCMIGLCDESIARYFDISVDDVLDKRKEMGLTKKGAIHGKRT